MNKHKTETYEIAKYFIFMERPGLAVVRHSGAGAIIANRPAREGDTNMGLVSPGLGRLGMDRIGPRKDS